MKKRNLLLTILAIIFTLSINATVWRVSNVLVNGIAVDADFTTLQDAINSASAGDTIYMMGSPTTYGDGVFDKQLVVIGPGYWLAENDTTQANTQPAQVNLLTFNDGSQGSTIQGLYIYHTNGSSYFQLITINTDDITLRKNYIHAYKSGYSTSGTAYSIVIGGNRSNILIKQNWIEAIINDWGDPNNATVWAIYFGGIPTNCMIKNNFIRAQRINNYGFAYNFNMAINDMSNDLSLYNNVFWGDITTYHTDHINNIWLSGNYGGGGDIMMHNLCNGTQFPDDPLFSNQQNVDMSTVFVDQDLYIDNGYFLAPGSPAIGAGINGGDCGVFGYHAGGIPYVLSGMPAIPAIYETEVVQDGTSVQVTIKAASHNEHK